MDRTPEASANLNRRRVLRSAALLGSAAATGAVGAVVGSSPASAGPAGFPNYQYLRNAFSGPMRYNPTGEYIFPCIISASDKVAGALGRFYLYYAPHENPGGICVAYSNSMAGPFTEYANNPIIDRFLPNGAVVSHVSSPHTIWDASARQFYLYFHGENFTTRVARSTNGLTFTNETPILSTRLVPGTSETSYARVFPHVLPGRNNRYVMLFMGVRTGRRIFYGWSPNGWDQWQFAPNPLINQPAGLSDIAAPHLLYRNNTTYCVYHGSDGRMHLTEVGNNFDRQTYLGVFHTPIASDNGRTAAPSFGTDAGVSYMFYEAGGRLNARIAIARAV